MTAAPPTCRADCGNQATYSTPTDFCDACWQAWWLHEEDDPDAALAAVLAGDRAQMEPADPVPEAE